MTKKEKQAQNLETAENMTTIALIHMENMLEKSSAVISLLLLPLIERAELLRRDIEILRNAIRKDAKS
jgi:hypothetical protein